MENDRIGPMEMGRALQSALDREAALRLRLAELRRVLHQKNLTNSVKLAQLRTLLP